MKLRSAFAFGLCACLAVATVGRGGLAEPAGKGSVKVTVTDKDGAALKDIEVQIQGSNRVILGGGGSAPKAALGAPAARPLQVLKVVAKGSTDKDGIVEFKDVAFGRYRLYAADPAAGIGRAPIEVKDAKKTLEVKLKLVPE